MINTERNQPTCIDVFLTKRTPAYARRWQPPPGYAVIHAALQLQPTCHLKLGQDCERGRLQARLRLGWIDASSARTSPSRCSRASILALSSASERSPARRSAFAS